MREDLKIGQVPHLYKRRIRETEVDSFGHVNNATYLILFEEARWEMIRSNGYGLKEIQQHRKGPVILEATVKYLREIKAGDEIIIHTWVEDTVKKIGQIYQEIQSEEEKIFTKFQITYGLMDFDRRRLVAPSEEWRKAVGGMAKTTQP